MTVRDRTVLIVVGMLAVLAAFWFLAISPKRKDVADVQTQVASAQQRLSAAQTSAASAEAARARYDRDYATVARLGKAVPVKDDVPALVYQLETTAHKHHVDFRRIALSASAVPAGGVQATQTAAVAAATGSTTTPSSTSVAPSALPPGATVGSAGFPVMPFSFDFQGSFFHMQRFLKSMDAYTRLTGDRIDVNGRLLTVDAVTIKAGAKGFPQVLATINATAYLLPADEGLTAGATATDPSGAGATVAAASTSTPSSSAPVATASLIASNR